MMSNKNTVSTRHTKGGLLGRIQSAFTDLGRDIESVTIDDLAPVDEFHVGGREATGNFISQLGFSDQGHLLDIGCGLGGPARYVADRYRNRVSGIDITAEYVDTGRALCEWVGLDHRVILYQGNALAMPFEPDSFDGAYMMHVGMNIENKFGLCAETHRVLRSGKLFGIYDIMRTSNEDLVFPVPWADTEESSVVASPEQYKLALSHSGFEVVSERNRREFAIAFFEKLSVRAANGPSPLGLHILMGDKTVMKIRNMTDNISSGRISPVEIIARKT